MSICEKIQDHCDHGRLFSYDALPTATYRRWLYFAESIHEELSTQRDWRWPAYVQPLLHRFVHMAPVYVRPQGQYLDKIDAADLVLLDPTRDNATKIAGAPSEIWELRIIRPRNRQIRIFGRFARKDCFIALTWENKNNVDYPEDMHKCAASWRLLFPGHDPLKGKGAFPNGYLSGAKLAP